MRTAWMTGLCPRARVAARGSPKMSFARDITAVGGGTLMSRLLAYVRDAWIACAHFAETLFAVLQVVNLFRRLLWERRCDSAFVPIGQLHGSTDGAANANRFTWRVLLMMFCVAVVSRCSACWLCHPPASRRSTVAAIVLGIPAVHGPRYSCCGARSRRSPPLPVQKVGSASSPSRRSCSIRPCCSHCCCCLTNRWSAIKSPFGSRLPSPWRA